MRLSVIKESLKKATAYMVRKDKQVFELDDTHPYLLTSKAENGSLEEVEKYISTFLGFYYFELKWIYDHLIDDYAKHLILKIVSTLVYTDNIYSISETKKEYFRDNFPVNKKLILKNKLQFINAWKVVNRNLNADFLRMRTSDEYLGGNSTDIFFRISSFGFDWFEIIWEIVTKNKNWINTITVEDDYSSKGSDKIIVNHMSVDDFIYTKPILMEKINIKNNDIKGKKILESLKNGKTYTDSFMFTGCPVEHWLCKEGDDFLCEYYNIPESTLNLSDNFFKGLWDKFVLKEGK